MQTKQSLNFTQMVADPFIWAIRKSPFLIATSCIFCIVQITVWTIFIESNLEFQTFVAFCIASSIVLLYLYTLYTLQWMIKAFDMDYKIPSLQVMFSWTSSHTQYFVKNLKIFLFIGIVLSIAFSLTMSASFALEHLYDQGMFRDFVRIKKSGIIFKPYLEVILLLFVFFLFCIVFCATVVKILMVLPAMVMGRDLSFVEAWVYTRGYSTRLASLIVCGIFLSQVCIYAIIGAVDYFYDISLVDPAYMTLVKCVSGFVLGLAVVIRSICNGYKIIFIRENPHPIISQSPLEKNTPLSLR